jgi:hypothetical protein
MQHYKRIDSKHYYKSCLSPQENQEKAQKKMERAIAEKISDVFKANVIVVSGSRTPSPFYENADDQSDFESITGTPIPWMEGIDKDPLDYLETWKEDFSIVLKSLKSEYSLLESKKEDIVYARSKIEFAMRAHESQLKNSANIVSFNKRFRTELERLHKRMSVLGIKKILKKHSPIAVKGLENRIRNYISDLKERVVSLEEDLDLVVKSMAAAKELLWTARLRVDEFQFISSIPQYSQLVELLKDTAGLLNKSNQMGWIDDVNDQLFNGLVGIIDQRVAGKNWYRLNLLLNEAKILQIPK